MRRLLDRLAGWWESWSPWALRREILASAAFHRSLTGTIREAYDHAALNPDLRIRLAKALCTLGGPDAATRPGPKTMEDPLSHSWRGPVIAVMAGACVEEFERIGGVNYVEHELFHRRLGRFTFTLQRCDGITPGMKAGLLQEEVVRLQAEALDLRIQLDASKEGSHA